LRRRDQRADRSAGELVSTEELTIQIEEIRVPQARPLPWRR
jgi:hypothetical protein